MADITQTLGFDASGALTALQTLDTQLGSLETKLNAVATAMATFKTNSTGIAARFGSIATSATNAATAIQNFQTAASAAANAAAPQTPANITALLATLGQAQQGIAGLTAAAGQAQTAIQKLATGSTQNLQKAAQAGDRLSVSMNTLVRVVQTQVIVRAMSALRGGLEDSLSAASAFQIKLAQIQTIGGPVAGTLGSLAIQVRNLSDEFAQPIEEVAQGFYDILSNQIGSASDAALVLRESLTLARVAVASTADAANALSSVLNSYNLEASSAADISGKLFKAVDLGRFTLSDVANTIGRVTGLAAEMGVSFDEVLASLATLTVNGIRADEAMTLLSNAMRGLLKPTRAMKGAFAELNVGSAEVGVATFGFQGFLEKLRETTNGTASEITQLTENIRVGRGVFGLTGEAAERFRENLEKIQNAGGNTVQQAQDLIVQTNAQQVQKELNELKNFFINDFGLSALKIIKDLFLQFGGLVNIIKSLRDSFLWVGGTIIAFRVLTTTVTLTRIAMAAFAGHTLIARNAALALGASMLSIPGAAILVGITAAVLALSRANAEAAKTGADLAAQLDEELNQFREIENKKTAVLLIDEKKKQAARTATAEAGFQQQQQLVARLQGLYKIDRDNAIAAQDDILDRLQGQLKERLSLIEKVINQLEQKQQQADQTIKKNRDESGDLVLKAEERFFSRRVSFLDETARATAELGRAQELQRRASAAASASDFDSSDDLLQTADQRAQAALELADERLREAKTSSAQAAAVQEVLVAENAVKSILQQRLRLREQENAQAKAQAEAAEKELKNRREQLRDAKELIAKISEFEVLAAKGDLKPGEGIAEVSNLTKQLEAVLSRGDIDVEQFLGIQDLTKKLRSDFESALTGKPVSLQFAFLEGADKILSELSRRTIPLKAVITDLETSSGAKFDLQVGFDNIALGLVNKMEQIAEGLEKQSALPQERTNLLSDRKQAETAAGKLSIDPNADRDLRRSLTELPAQFAQALEGNTDPLTKALEQLSADTEVAQREAALRVTAPDGKSFSDTAAVLAELVLSIRSFLERNENIKAQEAAAPRLNAAISQASADGNKALLTQFNLEQQKVLEDTNVLNKAAESLGPSTKKGVDEAIVQFGRIKLEADVTAADIEARYATLGTRLQDGVIETLARLVSGNAAEGQGVRSLFGGFARGGHVRGFATGGAAGTGTDTIPAMLSPNEFVVNSRSTRKFFSQLQSINSGHAPSFDRQGGTTNNTTVGDIIVNGAESPNKVARQVMAEIRREQRRGASRL